MTRDKLRQLWTVVRALPMAVRALARGIVLYVRHGDELMDRAEAMQSCEDCDLQDGEFCSDYTMFQFDD